MSKLDDIIAAKNYELQCLIAYRDIINSGDCNTCDIQKHCSIVPKPGQLVRYNCAEYVKKEEIKKK